ncbi:MAG TPA: right-handed parallel beta-helix repeat-containing protein [Nitrospiria bacterium]|nr:right-handed parallel beta-helix repeat-containing protein [Nitrospiria bacterium]
MQIHGRTKNVLAAFIIGAALMASAGISQAGTYWVSNTGAAAWANCTGTAPLNGTAACSVSTAMSNAVAGDVVNFRGGTYTVPYFSGTGDLNSGAYYPHNAGTSGSPITFQAYTGETPVFNGTTTNGGVQYSVDLTTVFTISQSYITFDGFHVQSDGGTTGAQILLKGTGTSSRITNVTIQNCEINGGTHTISSTDNRDLLRMDNVSYVLIHGCKIHNLPDTNPNGDATKSYNGDHVTIENNEYYNNGGNAIFIKENGDNWTVRYNWIHDNGGNGFQGENTNGTNVTNTTIHDNVIANNGGGIAFNCSVGAQCGPSTIYNNTIYGPNVSASSQACISFTEATGIVIYNNICIGFTGKTMGFGYSTEGIIETDYNNFGTGSFKVETHTYQSNDTTYTSLTAWKTSTELNAGGHPDTHSITSNPLFLNLSGNLTLLGDFALSLISPSLGTGQGGANMGADVTNVGTGVATINPPSNLRVQ